MIPHVLWPKWTRFSGSHQGRLSPLAGSESRWLGNLDPGLGISSQLSTLSDSSGQLSKHQPWEEVETQREPPDHHSYLWKTKHANPPLPGKAKRKTLW